MDPFNDRPSTEFGRNILEAFGDALRIRTPEPQVPIDLVRDLELSIQLNFIALALARCAWLQAGKSLSEMRWNEFSPGLQDRYRQMAERAIQCIDPKVRLDAKDRAAKETAEFIDSASDMIFNAKTWALIAHEAISRYESRLASLRVTGSND